MGGAGTGTDVGVGVPVAGAGAVWEVEDVGGPVVPAVVYEVVAGGSAGAGAAGV